VRDLEGLPRQSGLLAGEAPGEIEVEEHGVRYLADPLGGQKTGAFLDQRENRLEAGRLARGRVLDLFCYHGAFGLQARRADNVTAVDSSAAALERAAANARANRFSNIAFIESNVFDFLKQAERSGERFDTVLLDPPAFAKKRSDVEAASRAYKDINLRALRL
jgi:23S rRNA (cytosine1962-C5)-methyltransferase